MSTNPYRDTNMPRDHPEKTHIIRSDYYSVRYLDHETADIFLFPEGRVYDIGDGRREYDVTALVVSGVKVWPGMEESIRAHYKAWCEAGEPFD